MPVQSIDYIKKPVMIAVSSVFFILMAIFLYATYHLLDQHIKDMVSDKLQSVSSLLESIIISESELLGGLAQPLLVNEGLRQAFVQQDRTALLRLSQPIHNEMLNQHQVTHFYYHDLEMINFLRLHKPERHSDRIDRFTMRQAAKTGQPSYGFELGPLGTFTLRGVRPWYSFGKLIGYIELGKEIDSSIGSIQDILGVEIISVFPKKYLDEVSWKNRQSFMATTMKWESFENIVVANLTAKDIPPGLFGILQKMDTEKLEIEFETVFSIQEGRQSMRGGGLELTDASGAVVGYLLVTVDVTKEEESMQKLASIIVVTCLFLGLFLFLFFNYFLGKLEVRLIESRQELKDEITDRQRAEKNLFKQKEFLKSVIDSITHPFYVINVHDMTISLANKAAGFGEILPGATCHQLTHNTAYPCQDEGHPCTLNLIKELMK